MIVELAGLPGSGKSTIASRLAAETSGIEAEVLRPAWSIIVREPLHFVRERLRRTGWGRGTGWPAWVFLWMRWTRQRDRRVDPGQMLLLEEGIVHHVWRNLFLHPALEATPWRGLTALPHPIIVLELDSEARLARVSGKAGKGKVNRMLAESGTSGEAWRRGEALFEQVLSEARRHREIVLVSTAGSIAEATTRVRDAIDRLR